MPELWKRIDARRGFQLTLRRWARGFATAAAALCVAMVLYMVTPRESYPIVYSTTYVDALEQA